MVVVRFDRQGVTNAPKSLCRPLGGELGLTALGTAVERTPSPRLVETTGKSFLGAHPQGRVVSADPCKGAEPSAVGLFLV